MNYIFDIDELEKVLSFWVANYLRMGYRFYTKCSGGTQGDLDRIYLTNDKHILCFRITSRKCVDNFFYVMKHYLIIEEFTDFDADILWNDKGNFIMNEIFYVFDSHGKYKYTSLYRSAKEIDNKKRKRAEYKYRGNSDTIFKIDRCSSKLYRLVKSKRGYKNIKVKDITRIEHKVGYMGHDKRSKYYNKYIICIENKQPIILNLPIDK